MSGWRFLLIFWSALLIIFGYIFYPISSVAQTPVPKTEVVTITLHECVDIAMYAEAFQAGVSEPTMSYRHTSNIPLVISHIRYVMNLPQWKEQNLDAEKTFDAVLTWCVMNEGMLEIVVVQNA